MMHSLTITHFLSFRSAAKCWQSLTAGILPVPSPPITPFPPTMERIVLATGRLVVVNVVHLHLPKTQCYESYISNFLLSTNFPKGGPTSWPSPKIKTLYLISQIQYQTHTWRMRSWFSSQLDAIYFWRTQLLLMLFSTLFTNTAVQASNIIEQSR